MREFGHYVPPLWTMCAECVSSLLIMINFSGNFVIYCSVLRPFKAAIFGMWESYCVRRDSQSSRTDVAAAAAAETMELKTATAAAAAHTERKRKMMACAKERSRAANICLANSSEITAV